MLHAGDAPFFENAVVGWFDIATKSYKKIRVDEQCEVLSALGDIATGDDGKASLHVHVVLGLADGTTRGGGHAGPRPAEVAIMGMFSFLKGKDEAAGAATPPDRPPCCA